jgi:Na+/H+ antiporter NhaD/arsenite permease-like protein
LVLTKIALNFVKTGGFLITRDKAMRVLALATTFAGNLTMIGSVANMIVVESAREHLEASFWDYTRFGIPITILTLRPAWFCCSCCTENSNLRRQRILSSLGAANFLCHPAG